MRNNAHLLLFLWNWQVLKLFATECTEVSTNTIKFRKTSILQILFNKWCTGTLFRSWLFYWIDCFEPAYYLCPFVSAVAFFVWLTRLMKNVRHDCILNPFICGPDPINHDPASATNSRFPLGLFWPLRWGMRGVCLPTVSTALPAYQLFQWLVLRSWMGFKDGAVWDGKEGSYFHTSALLD